MAERFAWTTPDGTVLDLSDSLRGYLVTSEGSAGLRSPAWQVASQQYAGQDGEQVQSIKAAAGNPTLGLHVSADDVTEFRQRVRALVRALRPRAGGQVAPSTLTVSNETGEARSLSCYCLDGLPGDESPSVMLPGRWWKVALKLYAPDPWWVGSERTLSMGLSAGGNFFPIFPLALAPSSVQGEFTVDLSDADDVAYPVWTITGPGNSLVLTNSTTGLELSLDLTLATGESMTVDTRPGSQSVRKNDGTNLLPYVTPGTDPSLWPLIDGVNQIRISLTGATSDSRISGVYQPRYAGI